MVGLAQTTLNGYEEIERLMKSDSTNLNECSRLFSSTESQGTLSVKEVDTTPESAK
jgi:hypothetical protein